jgi:hypothetical protein
VSAFDGSCVYVLAPQARPNPYLVAIDTTTDKVAQEANVSDGGSLGLLRLCEPIYPGGRRDQPGAGEASVNGFPADFAVTPSGLNFVCATPPGASAAKTIRATFSRTPKPSFRFLAAASYRVYFIT